MVLKKGPQHPKRASRYKLSANEKVLLSIEGERIAGNLAVLSATGGTMRLGKRYTHGTLAEMKMTAVSGTISTVIEMLTIRNGVQAFRFVHFDRENQKRMDDTLKQLRAQGLGDDSDALESVIRFARRLIPGAAKG
ncbi:hypothetical protein Acid345_1926 [Candidatus Koribacter versatilis Ellin345]|uniref:PilZ domain-containing protein n=1 Tax=Koribacter versatilis (strain Ellin345) TaxID=204669 RepID=Q1IQC3_KORVE|nr:hypothetical protein [Candidatus Koribacter versatilis]ABF40927.1 hypothetical protein Acid345_1926 [Candidatus Koribacter versatilis Ellin345]